VIGAVRPSEIEVEVDFPSSADEVREFLGGGSDRTLLVGAFPSAENDVDAVTVDLPDADGIVRSHPH
jgi:hypothetical protein